MIYLTADRYLYQSGNMPNGFQRTINMKLPSWWSQCTNLIQRDIPQLCESTSSCWACPKWIHCSDVTMGTMASQIISLTIVYSTFYSGADQRNHQCSASLAFVWGIGEFPAQMASNAENVSIWWRHHVHRRNLPRSSLMDDVNMYISVHVYQVDVKMLYIILIVKIMIKILGFYINDLKIKVSVHILFYSFGVISMHHIAANVKVTIALSLVNFILTASNCTKKPPV